MNQIAPAQGLGRHSHHQRTTMSCQCPRRRWTPADSSVPPVPWFPFIPAGRLIPADAPDDYITVYPAYAWSTQQPPPFLAPGAALYLLADWNVSRCQSEPAHRHQLQSMHATGCCT